jgi:glycosyltransferase involved in cell wall biosynthesis
MVVSVGDLLAELRLQEVGRHVRVVPNGADVALFARARSTRPHPPTLIYMGTVVAWAGVDVTIAALARIRKEIQDARLLIVGHSTPEYKALLETLCKEHGVYGHVHFLGKKTPAELVDLLAQSDIGMAAFKPVELRKYAFSLKIIEYMAAGLPVITTVDTQSERVLEKHGAGIAVAYEPQAIAAAALQLFKDPEQYRSMAARGMEASAAYSWDSLILNGLYPALTVQSKTATVSAEL